MNKNINFCSVENQKIMRDFVNDEVLANVTDMMDDLLYLSQQACSNEHYWGTEEFANFTPDEDEDYPEVMQWFIVMPWFGERLRDKGEVVLERAMGWIWGRQVFGQEMILDGVIQDIILDTGILLED